MAFAAASRIRFPCSIERTPAATALRTAESEYACERTYFPTAWASSTAARISAIVNWVVSSSSEGDMAPPEAMILIWSTSRRICSRAALRDRKSTLLNSSHSQISYAVFCLKKKKHQNVDDIAEGKLLAYFDSNRYIPLFDYLLRRSLETA